jgi:hypothetical protein
MQQNPIFQRVQTHHEVRLQYRGLVQLLLVSWDFSVMLIHKLQSTIFVNLFSICDAPWNPSLK